MRLTEGLAGLVAQQLRPQVVEDATTHPRFKYFSEAGEDPYRSFLGVPIVDRGLLQGVLVVQTTEPRDFTPDDVRLLAAAGSAARADRQRGADARAVRRAGPPAALRAGPEPVVELGPGRRRACSASSIRCCGASSTTTRSRCCSRCRSTGSRSAPAELALHSRINYAYRRMQEYLAIASTPGARATPACCGPRPVAYFSAEFGLHESLPIYSGGLGILAGDHIKSASDLGIPLVGVGLLLRPGLLPAAARRDGWQHEDYLDVDIGSCRSRRRCGADGAAVIVIRSKPAPAAIAARVWQAVGRPQHAAAARLERRRQPARRTAS